MQVNLKPDGWHRRLQEYVFDDPPRFGSLCPYFWFTNFCILAFPFAFLFKGIISPIAFAIYKVIEKILEGINTYICVPMFEAQIMGTKEKSLIDLLLGYEQYQACKDDWIYRGSKHGIANSKASQRFLKFRELWMKKNHTTKDEFKSQIMDKLREKAKEDEKARNERAAKRSAQRNKDEAKAKAKAESRDKMINSIVKYTKWLVIPFGLALAAGILYLGYQFIVWAYSGVLTWNWAKIGLYSLYGLAGIAAIAAVVGFVVIIVKICKKCDLQMPSFAWVGKFFKGFGNLLNRFGGKFGGGITSVVEFFVVYVKAAKENYCPMIKWEDK